MTSVAHAETSRNIVVGVDTHKHVHVAVDQVGVLLDDTSISVDSGGHRQLAEWSETWGQVEAFGIAGTGSHGAGLASYLCRQGQHSVEVNRYPKATYPCPDYRR